MGVPTLTTARILKGQLKNQTGEEENLSWDKFPHVGFSKASYFTCLLFVQFCTSIAVQFAS